MTIAKTAYNRHYKTHAWSNDPERDRKVRMAEDKRDTPLPTLEECIAGVFPDGRQPEKVVSEKATDSGCQQPGLRTERVVLEITHEDDRTFLPVAQWGWQGMLYSCCESVRVVPEAEAGVLKGEVESWKILALLANEKRDALAARVAELESERDDALEQVAELERAALKAEQQAAAEPVAWGVTRDARGDILLFTFKTDADDFVHGYGGTVVPLFTAPPPQAGWLTERESDAVSMASREIINRMPDWGVGEAVAATLDGLLIRNAPPKVVTPRGHGGPKLDTETTIQRRDRQWIAALAAAGVAVEKK